MRLVNGGSSSGRVEICKLEDWVTICDQGWGTEEASVVCSQLGFSRYCKTLIQTNEMTMKKSTI